MKTTNDILKANLAEVGRQLPDEEKRSRERDWKLILAAFISLAIVGAEPVYAMFRKNFGKGGIDLFRLSIAFACFIVVSAILVYHFYIDESFGEIYGSVDSYLITAMLLTLLAVTFLVRGLSRHRTATDNLGHIGDSELLSFLAKDGWSQNQIQLIAEPLCVITIGGAYCFYNIIGGVAIAFCGVSVWLRTPIELFYLKNRVQNNINTQSENHGDDVSHAS